MSEELGLNGKPKGRGGPPPKNLQLQNRLTRASLRAAELRVLFLEEYNEEVANYFHIVKNWPVGKCEASVTLAHYKAAKDQIEEWLKGCERAEQQLDFLNKRDNPTDGGSEPVPANVAVFRKSAKKD